MLLLKLSCASCSAPLEISEDLERFACGYCGTEQIVKRAGGAVWLKKIETAVRDVQKGTDRTAAELVLVRLERELEEARESKAALMHSEDSKYKAAVGSRQLRTSLSSVAVFILLPITFVAIFGENVPGESWIFWIMACVFVPVGVHHWIKLPPRADIRESLAEIDALIARIEEQIDRNRTILDAPSA